MDKRVTTIYASEELLTMLELIQIDRDYASKIKIVDDLFSPNKVIRQGAFKYVNDFITRYHKNIADIEKQLIRDDRQCEKDRINEKAAEAKLINAKLRVQKKLEDDFNNGYI